MELKLADVKFLIVEDLLPMRMLLEGILEQLDAKNYSVANDGKEGFELFCRERPDIVLCDWVMEPDDGITFCNNIRRNSLSPNRVAPVIMLSGYNSVKRVKIARDAGVTEFLTKPFSASDLAKRLVYVVNNPRDFIECNTFFGPDRRRRIDFKYAGPFRRATDNK